MSLSFRKPGSDEATLIAVTYASRAILTIGIYSFGSRYFFRLLIAACLFVLVVESLQAAEWRFRPRLTVEGTYSDNITLTPDGESDFVTDISPGFTLNGKGRRFFFDVFYNLQYLHYAQNTGSNRFNNYLQVLGNGEVAEDLFFIDLRSTVRPENISNRPNTANSSISITDNVTNVYTFGISPYLTHRFGSFMDGEARYSFDRVEYEESSRSDSSTNAIFLNLKSGRAFQTFTWDTFYRWRQEDPEVGQVITFQRIEAAGSYHFNRKAAVVFGTGYEDNEFLGSQITDTTAVTWLAGVRLTPNPRTLLEGGAQNRFFGTAPYLNIEYRSGRTAFGLHYNEDVTTNNQVRSNQTFVPLLDPFGDPILDPDTGEATRIPIDSPGIRNEVLVIQQLDGTLAFRGQRTDVGFTVLGTRRDFQFSPNEDVYGIRAFATRRLSRRTSVRLSGRMTRSEFDGPTPNRTQWEVGIDLNRQFSSDFSGRIALFHITQDSKDPAFNYDENRLTLGITKFF